MKKILFVCSQNKLRSPTAENIFSQHPDLEVRSAGLNNDALVTLGLEDIIWADYIFVMEKTHLTKIRTLYKSELKNKKLVCLEIPDRYKYMDPNLIDILNKKVLSYIK